jgi:hypothetical protein
MVEHHSHGALAHFVGIPSWSWHGSNLSRLGASKKPGAIHSCPPSLFGVG